MSHKVFTKEDRYNEPEVRNGTVAVVHYGDYQRQEVWVASGANIGNWYPLGNEFGCPDHRKGQVPLHPTWADVVARGPVVLLTPGDQATYELGWHDGRKRLYEQVEQLKDDEGPPERETT